MEILINNLGWMWWNSTLALIGMMWGWAMVKWQRPTWKSMAGVMWLLFMPNTIYLITDLKHLVRQVHGIQGIELGLLVGQYMVLVWLAVITYMKGMQWFYEGTLKHEGWRKRDLVRRHLTLIIVVINMLMSLGIVMGRVMRTNSWYVVTQPVRVWQDLVAVLSQIELVGWVMVGGMVLNAFYFGMVRRVGAGERVTRI